MEYQIIINLLDNTPNQPTKFRTKNWVEIYDESRGTYNTYSQIRFRTSMLTTILCDLNDSYILKNCVPFTSCISRRNNKQIDHAQYIDAVMLMYNLIECSHNYSKTSGIL